MTLQERSPGWRPMHHFLKQVTGTDYRQAPAAAVTNAITGVVVKLYDLNRLALVTRYGDPYSGEARLDLGPSEPLTDRQLVDALGEVAYQCAEYLTGETQLYNHLQRYQAQLALAIMMAGPRYAATPGHKAA
ncbi:hypothetical protein ACQPW3_34925 [Actinosynnema sp. CA-248983]